MSSCELVTLISTLSCLIADNSTDDELSIGYNTYISVTQEKIEVQATNSNLTNNN